MVKIKIPKKPPKPPKLPKIPKVPKKPKKPKPSRPKKPPGAVRGPSKKVIAGVIAGGAALTGIGLYMKHRDKDVEAQSTKPSPSKPPRPPRPHTPEQPKKPKKPKKPKEPKKPTRPYGKEGIHPGPKEKGTQGKGTPVKWSKGYVKDTKGKVIKHKKLTAAEIRERQKDRGNR